ncbi:hypothetical protein AVEN_137483-1 [Araneus ventricosus]|uniref:Endonuclease/exonuclease/phosphatase domain-containing protein n=1 Tax=Araneus ventricosus TaxID=182803 RepID=A0A4Y2RGJ9_ARAVE|nr:hypothetical protein AVEN_137483-1 [Araneus ventricosus]
MHDELKSSFPTLPYSEEQGKRLHQGVRDIERRYQGRWDVNMLADYCWILRQETEVSKRKRVRRSVKEKKKRFHRQKRVNVAAHCHAFVVAEENVVDFLCVQDPYISDNVPLTGGKGCRMFCSFNNKSLIYCLNKDLDVVLGHNTNHIVGLFVKFGVLELQIISAYFPPHDNIDSLIE